MQGVSGNAGGLIGPDGSLEIVTNYRTGQVSGFAAGGFTAGWSGVVGASAFSGVVWGLMGDNSNYKGGFTSATSSVGSPLAHVGPQITMSSSSGGITNGVGQMVPNGQVNSLTVGINASLISPFVSGGVAATNFSEPLQAGSWWALGPLDKLLVFANQVCAATGN